MVNLPLCKSHHNAVSHDKVSRISGGLELVEVGPKVDPMVGRQDRKDPADELLLWIFLNKVVFGSGCYNRREEEQKACQQTSKKHLSPNGFQIVFK